MKCAFIFAGVNGAGKSTLYYNEVADGVDLGRRINMDEIVSSFGSWKSQKDQARAARIAFTIQKQAITNNESFNQETTLCGVGILKLFERLKACGYKICLYYVGVESVEIAKERVKMRVAKGGHDIDSDLIERRFTQSLKNLANVLPMCNEVHLYDNSTQLRQIATIIDGKITRLTSSKLLDLMALDSIKKVESKQKSKNKGKDFER